MEQAQGTGARRAEPWACRGVAALRARFDQEDRVRREIYPAVGGQRSRLAAHPGLAHSGRRYTPSWERRQWDVAVYDHNYCVGQQQAGAAVYVQLDPGEMAWVISDREGRELRKHAAKQLTRARLMALDLRG